MKSGKLREKFPEELFNAPRYTLDLWNSGDCLYIITKENEYRFKAPKNKHQ